jgi:hypothetical protein
MTANFIVGEREKAGEARFSPLSLPKTKPVLPNEVRNLIP